jgi:ketosteroid isomerase-like protein
MSQENVESARRTFEAFNRAFTEGADDLYALLDPEVEWIPVTAILEGRSYHGHEGVRRWIEDMKRDWEEFEPRPEEFLDLGDNRVLALGSWHARGRGGDVPLDFPHAAWLAQYPGGEARADAVVHRATGGPRSRQAVGVAARSRRDLDHRQSESLPSICEWVRAVAHRRAGRRRA